MVKKLGHVILVKTADERPTGSVVITSVVTKEYNNVKELIRILTMELYVFAVHENSCCKVPCNIVPLEDRFTSENATMRFLLESHFAFKRPISDKFFDMAGESFGEFLYKCGYDDRLRDGSVERDIDLRKEHEG